MLRLLPLVLLVAACGNGRDKDPADGTDPDGVVDPTDPGGPGDTQPPVDPPNEPPTVQITAPAADTEIERGTPVMLTATAADPDDPVTGLHVRWQIGGESACVGAPVEASGTTRCEHPFTMPIGAVAVTVVVEDPNGETGSDSLTLRVVRPADALPSALIVTPAADAEVFDEGDDILFVAELDDAIGQTAQGDASWSIAGDTVASEPPEADGSATYLLEGATQGPLAVALDFTTIDGLTASDTRSVYINGAPEQPSVAASPSDPRHHDALSAEVLNEGADPDADPLTYTWSWTLDGASTSYTTASVPAGIVQRDQVWQVTATASDGRLATTGSATLTINNTPPELAGVTLQPTQPRTLDDLTAAAVGASDIDSDPLTETWVWSKDGVAQPDLDGPSVPAARTAFGEVWSVTLFVSDDQSDSPAASTQVAIANTPPVLDDPTITPALAYADTTLTCGASATDPDDQSVTLTYAWTLGATPLGDGDTLHGLSAEAGDTLTCTATASDGVDTTTAFATVVIQNKPPSVGAVTLIPEAPQRGSTITCTAEDVVDVDDDEVTLSYAWWVDDALVPGATGSTLSGAFERDEAVRCEVTPADSHAPGSTVSSPAVTVVNTPPEVSAITIVPDPAYTNSPIRCEVDTEDDDDDVVQLSYAWFLNDAELIGEVAPTLPLFTADADDTLRCEVVADDGLDTTDASATVTVQNRPPQISGAELTPESPRVEDTFLCAAVGVFDADGDDVTLSYRFVDAGGAELDAASASPSRLVGDLASRDQSVACEVTTFDAPGGEPREGERATSPIRTVINTAPVALDDPTLAPASPTVQSTLSCEPPDASDADGDEVTWRYAWLLNGVEITDAHSATLSGVFERGDTVNCVATPFDGLDEGTARGSSDVTIANTPPSGLATLQPTVVRIGTTIQCFINPSPDPDGDTVTVQTYRVLVDDAEVASSTSSSTFPPSGQWRRDQVVRCGATLSDGLDATDIVSAPRTVENTAPTTSNLSLDAAGPGGRVDTFHCRVEGLADPDPDDIPTVRYAWRLNDAPIEGADGEHLDLAALAEADPPVIAARGDTLACSATPTDGISDGFTRNASRTLANTPPVVTNVRVSPSAPHMDDEIGCLYDYTDADGDADDSRVRWRRNGSNASPSAGHTPLYPTSDPPGASVGSHNPEAGDTIDCRVQPRDAFSIQAELSSDAVTVAPTRPTATEVTVTPTPSPPFFGASFACAYTFSDPRDLPDNSEVSWRLITREGGQSLVGTGSTYPGPNVRRGDRVECRVSPRNGTFNGALVTAQSVVVGNTPPPPPEISFGPADPIAGQDAVTCAVTNQPPDVDEDTITWRIRIRRGSDNSVITQNTPSGGSTSSTVTLAGSQLAIGDSVYCTAEAFDGALPFGGGAHSSIVTSSSLTAICPAGSGIHPSCPAPGCREAKDSGALTTSGKLWIEADGEVGATWCEHDLAGGNWSLAAVIADDGDDTWTWNQRAAWTDATTFGPDDRLDRDRKTVAFARVPLQDLLFVHAPSGEWAYYVDVATGDVSLRELLADAEARCQRPWEGMEMTDGTIDRSGALCSTRLYAHPEDQGGLGTCGEGSSHAWGPAWSTGAASSCPFDAPGATGSLGPDASMPDVESAALGFADALGLNTGVPGSGENNLHIYVRSGPTTEFDDDRDLRLATPFGNDCDDTDPLTHGDAEQPCGLSHRRDCSSLPPPFCDTCLRQLQEGEVDGDGTYTLQSGSLGAAPMYCDMTTRGGGWTLVQRTVWTWSSSSITGSNQLMTNLSTWRSNTIGNPAPGTGAYRLRGFQWPGQQTLFEHMLRITPRDAGSGADCGDLTYFADGTAFTVTFDGAVTRSAPTSSDVTFFNDSTLSTTDQGPSTTCVNSSQGVPWFYGACCSTCPTYMGSYWSDAPHPMAPYLDSTTDFYGNTAPQTCPSGSATPAINGSTFRGINNMSYFLR